MTCPQNWTGLPCKSKETQNEGRLFQAIIDHIFIYIFVQQQKKKHISHCKKTKHCKHTMFSFSKYDQIIKIMTFPL